jgi:hypothetical protein
MPKPTPDTFVDRIVRELNAFKALWQKNKILFIIVFLIGLISIYPLIHSFISDVITGDRTVDQSPIAGLAASAKKSASDSSDQLLSAEEALHMGKYAIARSMFKDSLLLESDQATADEIRGMVTATYYGEGLHQEGLEYICEQYKFKTANSHAFLFGVHAHLRAISVSSGSAKAETIAAEMRTKCQRPDFSEFWAHIPFGMMENLRIGNSRTSHGWTLTKEAKAKLSFLLDLKRRKAMKRRVPFADFALYFLDRFDEYYQTILILQSER